MKQLNISFLMQYKIEIFSRKGFTVWLYYDYLELLF